jgi:hypothetical protein
MSKRVHALSLDPQIKHDEALLGQRSQTDMGYKWEVIDDYAAIGMNLGGGSGILRMVVG